MIHTSTCTCGALTLTLDGELPPLSLCHCNACKKRSGSAYGAQVRLDASRVSLTGPHSEYTRVGDSGGVITYSFCPTCASTLCWTIDALPGSVIAAAGNFDGVELPAPTSSFYEERMPGWVHLPETVTFHVD